MNASPGEEATKYHKCVLLTIGLITVLWGGKMLSRFQIGYLPLRQWLLITEMFWHLPPVQLWMVLHTYSYQTVSTRRKLIFTECESTYTSLLCWGCLFLRAYLITLQASYRGFVPLALWWGYCLGDKCYDKANGDEALPYHCDIKL